MPPLARTQPTLLRAELCGGSPAVMVACGIEHLLLLTADGRVWSCGTVSDGQLGHGGSTTERTETALHTLTVLSLPCADSGECHVAMVAAGVRHSAAIGTHGEIWTWGKGTARLREGGNPSDPEAVQNVPMQLPTDFLRGAAPRIVAAGSDMTMIVTTAGDLWGWGKMRNVPDMRVPTRLGTRAEFGGSEAVSVACGDDSVVVLTQQGTPWVLGNNTRDCQGVGDTRCAPSPTQVPIDATFVSVGCHGASAWATTDLGDLYLWRITPDSDVADIELVADPALPGMRFGRFVRPLPIRNLAFTMGSHARLHDISDGPQPSRSPFYDIHSDVMRMIADACIEHPRGPVTRFGGIMQLLGAPVTRTEPAAHDART